jgi:hypothetical protein
MQNNILIHTDNLTGLNYLLNNNLRGKIAMYKRLEKPYFHNRRRALALPAERNGANNLCLKGRTIKHRQYELY